MNTIKITVRENIALLTLNRGRSNTINAEMVEELKDIFQNIEKDDNIFGVIMTGKDDYFSAGLDLVELFDYTEDQLKSFWEHYFLLIFILVSFKKPLVAAINGHAPAAGTLLSLCADYRIMARGNFSIGLNDVALGLIVPDSSFQLYSSCIGRQRASTYILEAHIMNPEEALNIALLNEVVPQEAVVGTAVKQMKKYLQYNRGVWQDTKQNIRKNITFAAQPHQPELIKRILHEWWAPYNRSVLQTIIQNFKSQ